MRRMPRSSPVGGRVQPSSAISWAGQAAISDKLASVAKGVSLMIRRLFLALAVCATPSLLLAGGPSEPLRVLFLGDAGLHRSADRAAQLIPTMASRGIDISYTDKVADLNPEELAKYDALIVYANIDEIEPAQEKA